MCTLETLIKLSTFTGLVIIIIDILLISEVMSINDIISAIKNAIGIINAVLFSISCTLYVFKLNQDVIKNDINNLFSYYWKSDLRVRGLEIINLIESIGLTQDEVWEFRDSIIFRARLKHLSVTLELLFLYFNILAYVSIYYRTSDPIFINNITYNVTEVRDEIYLLNLYISVISPILSIMFSYITVLCDNVIIAKDYVKAIRENRDREDILLARLKYVVRYPLLSVLTDDEIATNPDAQ